ncbi:alpha/beta hydrolase [Vibrio alfacsensis]|uniref:alpha/beta hydrolase n=1 Tax=Vibrio alfacsensis TaxID=1074311 RepID=UPI002ADE0561|nr:alpha/beta hydrolase [Vibrio alfacsensis]WQE78410.1 alpha/beta hydrolase [Vibrio alfacsensis]
MLFITNRTPKQSARSKRGRHISFDSNNVSVSQNLYFCERNGQDDYVEIMSEHFFGRLKALPDDTQLLFYIHGFNNNMEGDIFENAEKLQQLMDDESPSLVQVIPLIWPCDDDHAVAIIDDYWDDQEAADFSGPAFARLLGKFDTWRRDELQQKEPCYKRINVLAHSMGNRVMKNALQEWARKYAAGNMPQLFRNVFMIAADVENEVLEKNEDGRFIVDSGRNILVYFANDDFAMPASKVANIKNKTLSRRLGMTGPEDLSKLPSKVYEVDCDDFNNQFDIKGHTYFLENSKGEVSPIIKHMASAMKTGRVTPKDRSTVLK